MTNHISYRVHAGFVIAFAVILSAIMLFNFPCAALADEHRSHQGEFLDGRYGHNHSYPARGGYITVLPRGHRVFNYGRERYFFHEGVWYRGYGSQFLIVAPPLGLILPFLPPQYVTIWVNGVPYYYANDAYYIQSAGGYMVVAPPEGQVSPTPPPASATLPQAEQMFIYPRNGQNEKQQADDRYQCHNWAAGQTNYDPTRPPGGIPSAQKYADYKRAMSACLDARGYTVK